MRRMPSVSDFMDKSLLTIQPDTPMERAIELLIKKKLTGVLVVDTREKAGRDLVGEGLPQDPASTRFRHHQGNGEVLQETLVASSW